VSGVGVTVHEKPVGATVEWYTPPALFLLLLRGSDSAWFDLDPAGSPDDVHSFVPARRIIRPPEDGTTAEWSGHVWLNPPYGPAGVAFIDRMIEHGDGLLLLPSRTETKVYQRAWRAAHAVCLLRDRVWFRRNDGHTGRSSFGSTLFAFGAWAVERLYAADLGIIEERVITSVLSATDGKPIDAGDESR
jgi:hypothetical protein